MHSIFTAFEQDTTDNVHTHNTDQNMNREEIIDESGEALLEYHHGKNIDHIDYVTGIGNSSREP